VRDHYRRRRMEFPRRATLRTRRAAR
jgi:hypothetical protein